MHWPLESPPDFTVLQKLSLALSVVHFSNVIHVLFTYVIMQQTHVLVI